MKKIDKALLDWYEKNGRHELPWRNTDDIYHIYLSEIMLQQTQVSRVRDEYYPNFIDRFPTIQALGSAHLDDVIAQWSGLGYYSRARNLHKSASLCPDGLPDCPKELQKLPGIGQYTASAICSFGHHQAIPVVDTNIARVIKRYFALFEPTNDLIWAKAEELLNHKHSRAHNLALMDLGSMICTPKSPRCSECPLEKSCLGKDDPEIYTKTKKKEYESLELFYGIFLKENQLALVKSSGKMYKNMLELPSIDPIDEHFIGSYKHSYTKYRLDVKLYRIEEYEEDIVWIDIDKLDSSPISSLTKKAIQLLRK